MLLALNSYLSLLAPLYCSDCPAESFLPRSEPVLMDLYSYIQEDMSSTSESIWALCLMAFSLLILYPNICCDDKACIRAWWLFPPFQWLPCRKKAAGFEYAAHLIFCWDCLCSANQKILHFPPKWGIRVIILFWILSNAGGAGKISLECVAVATSAVHPAQGGSHLVLSCSDGSWPFAASLPCQRKWGSTGSVFTLCSSNSQMLWPGFTTFIFSTLFSCSATL